MQRLVNYILLISLLSIGSSLSADKIMVDPNTPAVRQAEANALQKTADEQLNQQVTYTGTGKRLHTVLEDISKMTNITVRCGKDKDDWQVRDLPVVVIVKNMPLGKLLQTLADCTHLAFSSNQVDGKTTYRIWRDRSRQKQLDEYFQNRRDYALCRINWEWDSWAKLGQLPESDLRCRLNKRKGARPVKTERLVSAAKLMAALPVDAKSRFFAGEEAIYKASNSPEPLKSLIVQCYRDWLNSAEEPITLTDRQMQNIYLSMKMKRMTDEMPYMGSFLNSNVAGTCSPFGTDLTKLGGDITDILPKLQESPSEPKSPHSEDLVEPDSSLPQIQVKVKLTKPVPPEQPTVARALEELSRLSSFSIICEDFQSHLAPHYQSVEQLYDHDMPFADAIAGLREMNWLVDKGQKLLVGSAECWYNHHKNLVPENMLVHLAEKANTTGVELDDLVPLCLLSKAQISEWFTATEDLGFIRWEVNPRDASFWKLYNSLSREDKALAKSDPGLPLARLNSANLLEAFQQSAKLTNIENCKNMINDIARANPELEKTTKAALESILPGATTMSADEAQNCDVDAILAQVIEQIPEFKQAMNVPTDPQTIMRLTLHIRKQQGEPYRRYYDNGIVTECDPNGFRRTVYYMEITGEGVGTHVSGPENVEFPIYSPKREAELWKQKQKDSAK